MAKGGRKDGMRGGENKRRGVAGHGGWRQDALGCGWTGIADLRRHRALVRGAASPCSLGSNSIGQDGATALAAALEKNGTLTSLE